MSWLKSHWKGIAALACGAAAVVLPPISPLAALGAAAICGKLGVDQAQEYLTGKELTGIVKTAIAKAKANHKAGR